MTIEFSRRAAIARESLSARDRDLLSRRLEILLARLETGERDPQIRRLGSGAGGRVFVMRVSRQLRAVFRRTAGGVEILDIVSHDQITKFSRELLGHGE